MFSKLLWFLDLVSGTFMTFGSGSSTFFSDFVVEVLCDVFFCPKEIETYLVKSLHFQSFLGKGGRKNRIEALNTS